MSFFDLSSFTFFHLFPLPLWKVLIDSIFAALMWILLLRFGVMVLFGDNPPVQLLRSTLQVTEPIPNIFKLFMPSTLTPTARSLFAAFLIFLLRYYGLPAVNDYQIYGLSSLPFESHLAAGLTHLMQFNSILGF
jgi:hypothetical protein